MKLIIAGSRLLTPSYGFIHSAIAMLGPHDLSPITEVVSGCAAGVDMEGEHWASHMNVPIVQFPAEWERLGKKAGPIRNKKMAEYGDALLLIWNGESPGSASMKREMEKLNKPVFEVILRKNGNRS